VVVICDRRQYLTALFTLNPDKLDQELINAGSPAKTGMKPPGIRNSEPISSKNSMRQMPGFQGFRPFKNSPFYPMNSVLKGMS
jgi:hypothetical protein